MELHMSHISYSDHIHLHKIPQIFFFFSFIKEDFSSSEYSKMSNMISNIWIVSCLKLLKNNKKNTWIQSFSTI